MAHASSRKLGESFLEEALALMILFDQFLGKLKDIVLL